MTTPNEYDENGFPIDAGTFRPYPPERSQVADLHVHRGVPESVPDCGYVDIAAMLDGGVPDPPAPSVCTRSDGVALFYAGQYNNLFGDPESGKTLLLDYASVEVLNQGGRVARLDLDHNGPESTINRLLDFGADEDALRDPTRFRYAEPDRAQIVAIVADMETWHPTLIGIDSIGELLPLFGANSNDSDDFTTVHTGVIKPLARTGAAVVGIDHQAKGSDSKAFGATGTAAKKRVIGGISIRVRVDEPFTPERGGSAWLTINKDRHGGLRRHCPPPSDGREVNAGKFVILGDQIRVQAPSVHDDPADTVPAADITAVAALDPAPTTVKAVREALSWRNDRASKAFRAWRNGAGTPTGTPEENPRSEDRERSGGIGGNVPNPEGEAA